MRPRGNAFDPNILQYGLMIFVLVCVLGVGLAVLDRVRRGLLRPDEESEDVAGSLQDAYDSGILDEAEYRRVREVLGRERPPEPPGAEPKIPRF